MKIVGQILLGVSFIMVLTASRCSSAAKLANKIKTSVNSATQASKKLGNKAAASAAKILIFNEVWLLVVVVC